MSRRRQPEPFWRAERNCYFLQIGAKQHRLDPDRDEAFRLYHELMAQKPEKHHEISASASQSAVDILDAFLEWVKANRAPATYEWYRHNCQIFAQSFPRTLSVAELKPYHVTRVMDVHASMWSNNTKNDFATAVQRAFNWAVDEGLIDRSPLARVKKPGREARDLAVSPAEYERLLAAADEPNFRVLIELAWETGARVQELRRIEARHLELAVGRIVFPPKESKGKQVHRVIYLTDRARALLSTLCAQRPAGPLLLNSQGKPWTKDSINNAFCRMENKLGKKYHLGAFRKGYATEALKAGLDTITVANLLGHVNGAMLSRFYAEVQQDPVFMAGAAKRAKGRVDKTDGDGSA